MSAPIYPLDTVAWVERSDGTWRKALRGVSHVSGGPAWRFSDGTCRYREEAPGAIPLVVLDPRDDAQMEALRKAYREAYVRSSRDALHAALITMLPTPEPAPLTEEPLDPAARPVDRDGHEWARTGGGWWVRLAASSLLCRWPSAVEQHGPFHLPEVTP